MYQTEKTHQTFHHSVESVESDLAFRSKYLNLFFEILFGRPVLEWKGNIYGVSLGKHQLLGAPSNWKSKDLSLTGRGDVSTISQGWIYMVNWATARSFHATCIRKSVSGFLFGSYLNSFHVEELHNMSSPRTKNPRLWWFRIVKSTFQNESQGADENPENPTIVRILLQPAPDLKKTQLESPQIAKHQRTKLEAHFF